MPMLSSVVSALLHYFLNRPLSLGIVETRSISDIRLQHSMIENFHIVQEQANRVCIIVQRFIQTKEKRGLQVRAASQSIA